MKSIQLIVDFDKHTSTPTPMAMPTSLFPGLYNPHWQVGRTIVVQETMVTGVWGWTCSYPCHPAGCMCTHICTYMYIYTAHTQ